MNLAAYDTVAASDRGADLELILPNGKPILDEKTGKPWTIKLMGVDSRQYQDSQHKVANRRINRRSRTRKGLSAEELDSDQLEVLLDVTSSWFGIQLGPNDPPLEFTRENARLVYTRFPWIRDQAEDFIGERSNYLGESLRASKNSPNGASS